MTMKRFAGVLAVAWIVSAHAQPAGDVPASVCAVTVSRDAISARFPALTNPSDVWRWQRTSTADSDGEYSWSIQFETSSGPATTPVQDYSHSLDISIFKFPGSAERHGSFADLMRAAQGDLSTCESSGSRCTRAQGLQFKAVRDARFTLISIARDPGVNALLAARPTGAVLSGGTPEQAWYCHVLIQYR